MNVSMNIHGFGAKEAVLMKPETAPSAYRIDSNRIKEDLQKAKENGQMKDLLQLSGVKLEDVQAIQSTGVVKRMDANYSLETFFRKDMPNMKNGDGTYTVSNVKFTEEELQKARSAMDAAYHGINGEHGQKLTLDYRDYASMKLAESAISQYAKENFNEDQQAVMLKAMKEYNAALEENQAEFLANGSFARNNYGDVSNYYGLSQIMDEKEAEALNNLKEELSKVTGKTYPKSVAGQYTGTAQIATNQELIKNIKTLFENVDLSDKNTVNQAMDKYQELMKPVYRANGLSSKSMNNIIRQDVSAFTSMVDKIRDSQQKSVDFSI